MKIVETRDYDEMSARAAGVVIDTVRAKPDAVLVLPTGNSPVGMFRQLVGAARAGTVDMGQVRLVTLDEYAGIAPTDRRSLFAWLRKELLEPLAIPDAHVVAFDSMSDAASEAKRLEDAIRALGGIDLAVLGIGPNGHLGFNEPGSAFDSRARRIDLTPESIASNAAYWGSEDDVPRHAVTLGLGTLFEARAMCAIASGAAKAGIVARLLSDPIGPDVPATMLRSHPNATLIADREALAVHETA